MRCSRSETVHKRLYNKLIAGRKKALVPTDQSKVGELGGALGGLHTRLSILE